MRRFLIVPSRWALAGRHSPQMGCATFHWLLSGRSVLSHLLPVHASAYLVARRLCVCAYPGPGLTTSQSAMGKRSVEALLRPAAAGQLYDGGGRAVSAGRVGGLERRCFPSGPVGYLRVDRFVLLVSLALLLAIILFISSSEVFIPALAARRGAYGRGAYGRGAAGSDGGYWDADGNYKFFSPRQQHMLPPDVGQQSPSTPQAIRMVRRGSSPLPKALTLKDGTTAKGALKEGQESVVIWFGQVEDDPSPKFFANDHRALFQCRGSAWTILHDKCLGLVIRKLGKLDARIYLVANSGLNLFQADELLKDKSIRYTRYLNVSPGAANRFDDRTLLEVGNLEDHFSEFLKAENYLSINVWRYYDGINFIELASTAGVKLTATTGAKLAGSIKGQTFVISFNCVSARCEVNFELELRVDPPLLKITKMKGWDQGFDPKQEYASAGLVTTPQGGTARDTRPGAGPVILAPNTNYTMQAASLEWRRRK